MKLTEKQAIAIAQAIYGKQDERVEEIEKMYKNTQSNVVDMIAAFIAQNLNWNGNANNDEVAMFLSNLKETFQEASSDDQSLIKSAYKGNLLKTNGDVLTAKITQQLVRQAMEQKLQIRVSTKNIPDVAGSKNYKSAKKKINTVNRSFKRQKSIDSILQKTAQNAVLDRYTDDDFISVINKQTLQTTRKIKEVAERAAKSPKDSLNWQREVASILTGGNKNTNGQMGRASGLIRSATSQVLNKATLDDMKSRSVKRYKVISLEAPNTCADCEDLDGNIYYVDDAEEGVNLPPFHWNCQCYIVEVNEDDDWDTSDHDVSEELDNL